MNEETLNFEEKKVLGGSHLVIESAVSNFTTPLKGKHNVKISSKLVHNCDQERVLKISKERVFLHNKNSNTAVSNPFFMHQYTFTVLVIEE